MKYCAPCRQRARDDGENCARCGGPLRNLGASPGQQRSAAQPSRRMENPSPSTAASRPAPQRAMATVSPPPADAPSQANKWPDASTAASGARGTEPVTRNTSETTDIQFKLSGLESKVQRTSRRVKILAAVAVLLAVSFTGVLFYLRHSYIMQFAEVDQLEIVRSEMHTGTALVRFRPLTAGRIQFVRSGGGRQETLLEYSSGPVSEGEFQEFHWTGDAGGSWSISIRHRDGSSLVDRDWQSAERKDASPTKGGVLAVL